MIVQLTVSSLQGQVFELDDAKAKASALEAELSKLKSQLQTQPVTWAPHSNPLASKMQPPKQQ